MRERRENTFASFIKSEKEVLSFSLFVSIYLLLQLFKFPNFKIDEYGEFWFGEATSRNVSIGNRISFFYNGMFALAGFLSVFYFLFRYLNRKFNPKRIRFEMPFYLSSFGAVLTISNVFGAESKNFVGILLLLFFIFYLLAIFGRKHEHLSALLSPQIAFPLFLYSFFLILGITFLADPKEESIEGATIWYGFTFLLISILFLWFKNSFGSRKALLMFWPLVWVPLITFLSSELTIAIKYSGNPLIDFQIFFGILFGLIYIFGYTIFRKGIFSISYQRLSERYFVIGVLAAIAIFTMYHPIVKFPHELFESANPANAQMRLWEFDEIPFVDFMSSHMLQEQWSGWIYHLIYGYSGDFDFMAYFFFNDLIFLILLYFIFKEVLGNAMMALLLIICLPFIGGLFNPSLLLGVLPIFFLMKLQKSDSVVNYLKFFWVVIFMIFWKLDTGFASLVASGIGLVFLWFADSIPFNIKNLLISLSITFAILLFGLAITFWLRSPEYVMANIEAALHYFRAGQAHGYPRLTWEYNQDFYMQYVLMPIISVILIIYSAIELKFYKKGQPISFTQLTGLFFLLFFLGNFQRGLVRHSFLEKLDFFWSSFFFTGVVFLLVHWFSDKSRRKAFIILFVGNLSLFVVFKAFNIGTRRMYVESALAYPSHIGFKSHLVESQYDSRVEIEEELQFQYVHTVEYLEEHLKKGETFYDFSNTPLLYYLTQKPQPSYFCQNLQNSVGDFLQLKQIDQLEEAGVPLVVFSNEPLNFWDRTDGLDNTLRYYLIAEYLFQNYQPEDLVVTKWIWRKKKWNGERNQRDLKTFRYLQYGFSAGILTEHLKVHNEWAEKYMDVKFQDLGKDKWYEIEVNQDLLDLKGAFIQFEFDLLSEMYPEERLDWTIHYLNDGDVVAASGFEAFENKAVYTLRLTNFYNWYHSKVESIRIYGGHVSKERMKLKSIKIIKDKRVES